MPATQSLPSPTEELVLAEAVPEEATTQLAASQPPVRLRIAEAVGEPALAASCVNQKITVPQSWPAYLWYTLCGTLEWLFGLASLCACLAVAAAIPIGQFVSLGYLLEASGRVARSGRLRDGFIDIDKFARIGSLVAGTWLVLLPLRLLSDLAYSAYLIEPGGASARAWRFGLLVCTVLAVGHILLAWYSGGRLRHFFWPLLAPFQFGLRLVFGKVVGPIVRPIVVAISPKLAHDLYVERPLSDWFPPAILWAGLRRGIGPMYAEARDAVWNFVVALRAPYYFWLGLRGFAGALAWLFLPVIMLIAGTTIPNGGGIVIGWFGAFLLAGVLLYLPFLQAHFACQNRFTAMFEWRAVRDQFRRAPIAFWFALLITLLFALPLYLLKIEATPREVTWLPALVFVVFIYPARLLTGWAVGRAMHRSNPRHFVFRWAARLTAIPIVLGYLLIVFFTQYTSWYGPASLFEQHAFLLPVPFLGL